MGVALVWFRDDLRLDDHPALRAALERGLVPVPVYIHAPDEEGDWAPGAASNAWRRRSLAALAAELRRRGSRLLMLHGPSLGTLQALAALTGAEAVLWCRRYEPRIEARDTRIKRQLRQAGLHAESFNGSLLFEPWEIETRQGDPYRVFTPFWKAARAHWRLRPLWQAPERLPSPDLAGAPEGRHLDAIIPETRPDWDAGFWEQATPPQKKPALTRFRRLACGELDEPSAGFPTSRYALLECAPVTGRFRQIRRHLKHASHHLIGDTSHGDGRHNRAFRMRGVHRMLLHAWQLGFPHPRDGRRMTVVAPPSGEFIRAMALFGWSLPEHTGAAG